MTLLFWLSASALAYITLGYPLLMLAWAWRRPRPVRATPEQLPEVAVIIVAHNEAALIERRISNLLALDYPRDRMTVIVASDGSTDDTVARARRHESDCVRVLDCEGPRGKPAVLRDAAALARGPLIVFADARQRFEHGALRALVAPFVDANVGCVSGTLILEGSSNATGRGLGLYWRYEELLRRTESAVDSMVGVTGAIYAVRRELFETIPDDTLLDDVLIPMRVVRRGYRVVLAEAARALDRPATHSHELRRHARLMAGNFQLFSRERWLLDPRRNRLWLQTLSHKALRLTLPILLLVLLTSNLALALQPPFYLLALLAQLTFYSIATLVWLHPNLRGVSRWIAAPYTFCVLNLAVVVGLVQLLTGGISVTWRAHGRTPLAPPVHHP